MISLPSCCLVERAVFRPSARPHLLRQRVAVVANDGPEKHSTLSQLGRTIPARARTTCTFVEGFFVVPLISLRGSCVFRTLGKLPVDNTRKNIRPLRTKVGSIVRSPVSVIG